MMTGGGETFPFQQRKSLLEDIWRNKRGWRPDGGRRRVAQIAPDNSYSSGSTFLAYRSFATRSASDWNAVSTLTPAFAEVKWNGLSYARAAWTISSSLICN